MLTICSPEPNLWYQGVQCILPVTVLFRHSCYVEGAHSSPQLRREITVLSWVYFNVCTGGPWFLDVPTFHIPASYFCTQLTNKHFELPHSGAVSKANISVFAWSQQRVFIKQCSFVPARNSCKHHTMPTCSHSSSKMCSFHIYSHTCSPTFLTCLRPWNSPNLYFVS